MPDMNMLHDLIKQALAAGADAADAVQVDAISMSAGTRLSKIESVERAESGDLGLRVLIGTQQAVVSTSDRKPATLREMVARAVAMAKAAPEDKYCGLADPADITKEWPQLDLADTHEPSSEALIALAREGEEAALAIEHVTNSEGAQAGYVSSIVSFAASNGFSGQRLNSAFSIHVTAIAGEGTEMESDYDYATRVYAADMPAATSIGRKAGERAARRLGARKMQTGHMPVVFDPRLSGGLLSSLASAISGPGIARGTSFLKDKMGQAIFPEHITIVDDPHRARGLRSRPFDAEGLLPQRRKIIDKGVLTTWLLDLRSARQLGLRSTAHAARSAGGTPSPSASNLYMEAGSVTPADLMKDIKQGFYVTDLMGQGVNGVTGDYSRAASGFWIENGQITFPVSEMTIAGNLKDMFRDMTPANDLEFTRGVDAPTLRIERMTVAGM
jgi:PmbA protein